MLLSFSATNFKSFREKQTLDLTASALQPAFNWLEHAAVPVGKEDAALRVKAIYGANASGKSNLIQALYAMLQIGVLSAKQPGILPSNVNPYQIDFVEKGEDRASIIYSLSDVKGIRKEADFESDYLGGSYGAVPDVTDFNIAILED